MNRLLLGGLGALLLVALGLFWWQGRAEVVSSAPPPQAAPVAANPEALPSADLSEMAGPAPPEASELTREQQRFFRYDRNRDLKITRNEMLSTRTDGFRALDVDGNNLLTFEEWAVTTVERFDEMDKDRNRELNAAEFATSAPPPRPAPTTRCRC